MLDAVLLLIITLSKVGLAWLIFQLILVGWGALTLRAIMGRLTSTPDWLLAFWVGWSLVIILLQVWHLFQPINTQALVVFGAIGIAGVVLNRHQLIVLLRRLPTAPGVSAFTLAGALLIANSALGPVVDGDYAFYQQQVVMWNSDYAIIPGLGNLHGRFAFNNATLLWGALADTIPYLSIGRHVAGSLPAFNLLLLAIFSARSLLISNRPNLPDIYAALLLPIALWLPTSVYTSNPETDLTPLLLGCVIGWLLWRHIQPGEQHESRFYVLIITVLGVAGVVSKVSFGAPGGLAVLLAYGLHWQRHRWQPDWLVPAIFTVAIAAFGIWIFRSVLLSGYAVYPVEHISFDLDWRVSCLEARRDQQLIYAFARTAITPGTAQVMPGWSWLSQWSLWALRYSFRLTTPLVISAVALTTWLSTPYRRRRERVILAVPLLSIGFWFFTAPDPRFIASSMWVLANSAVVLALLPIKDRNPPIAKSLVLLLAVGLGIWQLATWTPLAPYPERGFHPAPSPPVTMLETDSGLSINIPTSRLNDDPLAADRCYDAPLPCTPYFDPALALRVPGNIQAGIRDTGAQTCEQAITDPPLFRPAFPTN